MFIGPLEEPKGFLARVWDRCALTGLWVFRDWVLYPFWSWVVQPCFGWLFGWIFDLFATGDEEVIQDVVAMEQLDNIAVGESDLMEDAVTDISS